MEATLLYAIGRRLRKLPHAVSGGGGSGVAGLGLRRLKIGAARIAATWRARVLWVRQRSRRLLHRIKIARIIAHSCPIRIQIQRRELIKIEVRIVWDWA